MEIKKLLSEKVGEHHPVEALIFASNGDVLITKKDAEAEGYPLQKILSTEQIKEWINAEIALEIEKITIRPKCKTNYNAGGYQSSC